MIQVAHMTCSTSTRTEGRNGATTPDKRLQRCPVMQGNRKQLGGRYSTQRPGGTDKLHAALPKDGCRPVSAVWQPLVMVPVAKKMNSVVKRYSAKKACRKALLYCLDWLPGSSGIETRAGSQPGARLITWEHDAQSGGQQGRPKEVKAVAHLQDG